MKGNHPLGKAGHFPVQSMLEYRAQKVEHHCCLVPKMQQVLGVLHASRTELVSAIELWMFELLALKLQSPLLLATMWAHHCYALVNGVRELMSEH